ncbi:GNAT family N-acetyltransferase [Fulvivirga sp. 29W222]|uniref:GNAT family N-acetyltransferase n=1 Tax=Fulvivirga marina TaxID=2494733 RepID=A0A937KB39_9BACT|nr:GNAT family N-acetyltransferase [Fulvivirga marina]MBL6446386.1 GNAT family N-acetyltransferase [Fulvivirga marina]
MIKIREATKGDVDILYNMIMGIAKFHDHEEFVITDKQKMLSAGFNENPKFGALIAEFNDEVAGYLSYTWNYSIWNGSEYMNLDDLFVWEEYRKHKVGLNLMQRAKEICSDKAINMIRWEVETDNIKAIDFYNRLGVTMKEKGLFRWDF